MTLKLQVGKYYRTRDGRKVGPMRLKYGVNSDLMVSEGWKSDWYSDSGKRSLFYETDEDLVEEWKEGPMDTEEYKPWKDLTDVEKGELLLAHHEGKVIQRLYAGLWTKVENVRWVDSHTYRIKPEPVVDTRNLYIYAKDNDYHTTKVGTIRLINGKPDVDSIKMEEL